MTHPVHFGRALEFEVKYAPHDAPHHAPRLKVAARDESSHRAEEKYVATHGVHGLAN
jgi:hypothetical protein